MPDPEKIKGRPRTGIPKWAQRVTNPEPLTFPTSGGGKVPSGKLPFWQKPLGQMARGALTRGGTVGLGRGALGLLFNPYLAAAAAAPFAYSLFQKPIQKMWGLTDWQAYRDAGGGMSEPQWVKAGRPATPQALGGEITGVETEWSKGAGEREQAYQMYRAAAMDAMVEPMSKQEWMNSGMPPSPSVAEIRAAQEVPETPREKAERELIEAQTGQIGRPTPRETFEEWGQDPGENWHFNPNTGKWEFLPPEGYISPAEQREQEQWQKQFEQQQEVFNWQQQVRQQEMEADRNRQLAQLRANPASWLEYASLAGQTPQIQPWMLPLMPQQYAGSQAGAPIPGYQAGGEKMNLPGLTTPSAQYMSRMSPSARQQYFGFEQARTGASPEDVQWRLWSQSPPSGRYQGLRRTR